MNQSPHPGLASIPARIFEISLQLENCVLKEATVAYRIVYCTKSHPRGHIVDFAKLHPTCASIQSRGAEPQDPSEDVPTDARAWSPTGARNEWRPELSFMDCMFLGKNIPSMALSSGPGPKIWKKHTIHGAIVRPRPIKKDTTYGAIVRRLRPENLEITLILRSQKIIFF